MAKAGKPSALAFTTAPRSFLFLHHSTTLSDALTRRYICTVISQQAPCSAESTVFVPDKVQVHRGKHNASRRGHQNTCGDTINEATATELLYEIVQHLLNLITPFPQSTPEPSPCDGAILPDHARQLLELPPSPTLNRQRRQYTLRSQFRSSHYSTRTSSPSCHAASGLRILTPPAGRLSNASLTPKLVSSTSRYLQRRLRLHWHCELQFTAA